ncbi:MAG: hypothetical protein JSS97_03875 [Actinobacteria bacterium]|nr:hypothetical protein [Actinomycetota bacterium]
MSMQRGGFRIGLVLALIGLAVFIVGCGGGSSSSSSASSDPSPGPEPSAEFKATGGGKKIVDYGKEGSLKEREAANAVVVKNLKAREAGEWAVQCETLAQTGINEIPGAKNHGDCPKRLKEIGEPLARTKKLREDTLSGSIAVLRVDENIGYALYHGTDGKEYAVPLKKENGKWGVSGLIVLELNRVK